MHPGEENGIVVTRHAHASLHEAAYDEEPPPSGVQIR